jgi:dUTP pyrophosphatase
MPAYATADAACFDLHAATVAECQHIGSVVHEGYPITCETGLAFEIPQGNVMLIFGRSGHGFKDNVRLSNCVGVIDADYRGEVKVKLTCDIDTEDTMPPLFVRPGDRVAQAIILPYEKVEFIEADELTDTERGTGGFGSTGQ